MSEERIMRIKEILQRWEGDQCVHCGGRIGICVTCCSECSEDNSDFAVIMKIKREVEE